MAFECLDTITGIAQPLAEIILSEAGNDMTRSQQQTILPYGAV